MARGALVELGSAHDDVGFRDELGKQALQARRRVSVVVREQYEGSSHPPKSRLGMVVRSSKNAAMRPNRPAPPRARAIAKTSFRSTGVYGYHQSSRFARLRSSSTNRGRVSSLSAWAL